MSHVVDGAGSAEPSGPALEPPTKWSESRYGFVVVSLQLFGGAEDSAEVCPEKQNAFVTTFRSLRFSFLQVGVRGCGVLPINDRRALDEIVNGVGSDGESGAFLSGGAQLEVDVVRSELLRSFDEADVPDDVGTLNGKVQRSGEVGVDVGVVGTGVQRNNDPFSHSVVEKIASDLSDRTVLQFHGKTGRQCDVRSWSSHQKCLMSVVRDLWSWLVVTVIEHGELLNVLLDGDHRPLVARAMD